MATFAKAAWQGLSMGRKVLGAAWLMEEQEGRNKSHEKVPYGEPRAADLQLGGWRRGRRRAISLWPCGPLVARALPGIVSPLTLHL